MTATRTTDSSPRLRKQSSVFSSEAREEGLEATLGRQLSPHWTSILKCNYLPLTQKIVLGFSNLPSEYENTFLLKKQNHSGCNYMESIFVLCFQKDRGLRLSPRHPEARRHTGYASCWPWMKAVVPEGMPDLCLLCAYVMGGMAPALTLSMSPQGRETSLQPVHGHNQHHTGAGRRASRSGEGLRVVCSGSCMAHLS